MAEPLSPAAPRRGRLSPAEQRELLLTRAAIERAELAEALADTRAALRPAALLGAATHGVLVPRSLQRAAGWLRDYPMLTSVGSVALAVVRRTRAGRAAGKVVRIAAVVGLGAWAAIKLGQRKL